MTIISEEGMKSMNPKSVITNGIQYALVPGRRQTSYVKIYRKHPEGWEFVTWVGALAVGVLYKAGKRGLLNEFRKVQDGEK